MLALTRKQGESLVIDERIIVTVLKVTGQTVKIGVEASRDVLVVRGELASTKTESDLD